MVVYGPPGAGKAKYVKDHRSPEDVIVHNLAGLFDLPATARAWMIVEAPTAEERAVLQSTIGDRVRLILVIKSRKVCGRQADEWFRRYTI